jgi:hypothetical protein
MVRLICFLILFSISFTWSGCIADKHYAYNKDTQKESLNNSNPAKLEDNYLMKKFDALIPKTLAGIDSNGIDGLSKRIQTAGTSRGAGGLITSLATDLIGQAATAINTIITNEQSKYTTVSSFVLTDSYFYDQPSTDGPFDPVGMQFKGFDVVRTVKGKDGQTDTAFIARFALDTNRTAEILYNSTFMLKMTDFRLKNVKPKVSISNKTKKLSVEFDISFIASYINHDGNLIDNITLGKFHKLIQGVSIDLKKEDFGRWTDGDSGVTGKSFIIPRSYGYVIDGKKVEKGYNRGLYSILITVKESTNPTYATKMMIENGNIIVNTLSKELSTKVSQDINH